MTQPTKIKVLLFLIITASALLLLATSLPSLELQPGRPFSLSGDNATSEPFVLAESEGGELIFLILRGFLALALLFLPVYIFLNLLNPQGRKNMLAFAILIGMTLLLLAWLGNREAEEIVDNGGEAGFGELGPSASLPVEPTDVFIGDSPPWLLPLVSAGVAVIVAGVIAALVWKFWQPKQSEDGAISRLGQEALQAVEALGLGADVKDTVIRCYLQMSQILAEEQGLRRGYAMTPREFGQILERKGFPQKPVRQITQLFEEVRYGSKPPGRQAERLATESLAAIVEHCRVQR